MKLTARGTRAPPPVELLELCDSSSTVPRLFLEFLEFLEFLPPSTAASSGLTPGLILVRDGGGGEGGGVGGGGDVGSVIPG